MIVRPDLICSSHIRCHHDENGKNNLYVHNPFMILTLHIGGWWPLQWDHDGFVRHSEHCSFEPSIVCLSNRFRMIGLNQHCCVLAAVNHHNWLVGVTVDHCSVDTSLITIKAWTFTMVAMIHHVGPWLRAANVVGNCNHMALMAGDACKYSSAGNSSWHRNPWFVQGKYLSSFYFKLFWTVCLAIGWCPSIHHHPPKHWHDPKEVNQPNQNLTWKTFCRPVRRFMHGGACRCICMCEETPAFRGVVLLK